MKSQLVISPYEMPMTANERIREYLSANGTRAYCDDCLSTILKISPRQAVQQKTAALAKTHSFRRALARCTLCKSDKLVIGLRAPDNSRAPRAEDRQGNRPQVAAPLSAKSNNQSEPPSSLAILSEDEVKRILQRWLTAQGWSLEIAWAKTRGIDIHAHRSDERWVIEVKGGGSLQPMRVNYFLGVLGETLQRMDDPHAAYSIALPDLKQFRNLWSRLPILAKERTKISALFVTKDGSIDHVKI